MRFHVWVYTSLLVLAVSQTVAQYGTIAFGSTNRPIFDVRSVWHPLAVDVLNGAPLYGPTTWDNKPPLFQYVNLAAEATGYYLLAFYLAVGIANGIGAVLLWRLVRRHIDWRLATLAAVLYVGSIPLLFGVHIGPRSFAIPLLLAALSVDRGVLVGGLLGAATLFTQFAALATPAVIWWWVRGRPRHEQGRWVGAFTVGGLAVAVAAYGLLAIVWGPETLRNGLRYTLFAASGYAEKWGGQQSQVLLSGVIFTNIYYLVVPALFGGGAVLQDRDRRAFETLTVALTVSLLLALAVRAGRSYVFLALPFLSTTAALGIGRFLSAVSSRADRS